MSHKGNKKPREDEGDEEEDEIGQRSGGVNAEDRFPLDEHTDVRSFYFDPPSLTPLAQQLHLERGSARWSGTREEIQLLCPKEACGQKCNERITYFYAVDASLAPNYTDRLSPAQLRINKNIKKAWAQHQPHCVSHIILRLSHAHTWRIVAYLALLPLSLCLCDMH